jgi:MarR family 2-MHQ and catechol resistance regulon transcriptional repressor
MGTHYAGTKTEVRALDAYIKLMRAASAVAQRVERRLPALGLSESQFGVLEILLHRGSLNQRGLGQKLFRSGGNITMVVDNLERRGLVRRERDAADRRHVKVHLTDEGRRLIQRIFPGHVAAIVRELSPLGVAQQEELGRLCKKVGKGRA